MHSYAIIMNLHDDVNDKQQLLLSVVLAILSLNLMISKTTIIIDDNLQMWLFVSFFCIIINLNND